MMKYGVTKLKQKAYQYRKRFLDIFTEVGYGHLTSAFSWTEIATVLYHEIMQFPPYWDEAGDFDKMVISKGHSVGMLFPIFEDLGYFTEKELMETIRVGGSNQKLRKLYYPGFDFYGGSLGIGLGVAAGLAKGAKLQKAAWKVYCLVGDAECYEGSIWEAMNFAGHQQLDNLIVIVDRNFLGCSDFTEHMLKLEPFKEKWLSCNWDVCEIDGHDVRQVYEALSEAGKPGHSKPQCIIAHTKKGKGLEYLVDRPLMHGYIPKGEEVKRAYESLQ
ncbi:transketolase [Neglecta sp. X4]|uniref:transketolase n=1 Tax=unclassified Neglectibacter TaxID=2632164 RepID=UPI00136FA57F|nr:MULTISPECIES: 1-deoxy-D-xylulose-5-phosphate synthase N-terminal domain-containing protein [unclassified Neglectibacter]NBI18026.1 transketolase [Neglectibacter sp. 59]NBJ73703.1 transketolase [Neglectibacter sp. X4]NCE81636.1 transketolase [Neglectibacter sp. X58]